MKTREIVTITKIIDTIDERIYYYTVDNKAFKWHFSTLVDAENFVKHLGAHYNYEEKFVEGLIG